MKVYIMRGKGILFIIIVSVVGLLFYAGACKLMGYPIFGNARKAGYVMPVYSGREGELLPNVDLLLLDSTTHINIADIPGGKPIVLFYFGPYCPYCQAQTEDIIKHIKSLQHIEIFMVTVYSYTEMKSFCNKNELDKYNNIKIGLDYNLQFGKYFNTTVVPCTAIYNANRKLNSVYLGTLKYDQIKEVSED